MIKITLFSPKALLILSNNLTRLQLQNDIVRPRKKKTMAPILSRPRTFRKTWPNKKIMEKLTKKISCFLPLKFKKFESNFEKKNFKKHFFSARKICWKNDIEKKRVRNGDQLFENWLAKIKLRKKWSRKKTGRWLEKKIIIN